MLLKHQSENTNTDRTLSLKTQHTAKRTVAYKKQRDLKQKILAGITDIAKYQFLTIALNKAETN